MLFTVNPWMFGGPYMKLWRQSLLFLNLRIRREEPAMLCRIDLSISSLDHDHYAILFQHSSFTHLSIGANVLHEDEDSKTK